MSINYQVYEMSLETSYSKNIQWKFHDKVICFGVTPTSIKSNLR